MRKARRVRLGTVTASILCGSLALAGCGAGGGTGGSGSDVDAVSDEAAAFMEERASELDTTSISVLAQSSPQADAIEAISPQFTELTGIDVDWTILDEESVETKSAVSLGSDSGSYDVMQTPSGYIPSYTDRGWLKSIDELADEESNRVPGWSRKDFGQGLNGLLTRDDTLYGVPMFIGTQVFYYRTDIFKENGIEEPPSTYRELAQVVEKIHSDDVSGIALRTSPSVSQLLWDWSAWLYAFGGSYYKDYNNGEYSGSALSSPEAVEALELYTELVTQYGPSGVTNWSVDDVTRSFMSGKVAIIQEGAVFGGTFNNPDISQVAGKVDSFVMPSGPSGQYVPFNTHGWTIPANAEAMDAAWLFVQWATLEDTLVSAVQGDANFGSPPLQSVYKSDEYQAKYGFGSYVDNVIKTLDIADSGGASPLEGDPNYHPATPDWATVGQQIAEELSKSVTGQTSAEDALDAASNYLE